MHLRHSNEQTILTLFYMIRSNRSCICHLPSLYTDNSIIISIVFKIGFKNMCVSQVHIC
jgi:hypothetical protein